MTTAEDLNSRVAGNKRLERMKGPSIFYFVGLFALFLFYGVFNLYKSEQDAEISLRGLQERYNWYSIASSTSGTHKTAVEMGGFLYLSSDRGNTWTMEVFDESRNWKAVTSNADGTRYAYRIALCHFIRQFVCLFVCWFLCSFLSASLLNLSHS